MFWLAAGREGFDDDHAAAATAAGPRQHAGFVGSAVVDVSAGFGQDGTPSNSRARAMLAARLPLANNP
jgi:hypothetical protein